MKARKIVSGATVVALALAGVLITGGGASAEEEVTPPVEAPVTEVVEAPAEPVVERVLSEAVVEAVPEPEPVVEVQPVAEPPVEEVQSSPQTTGKEHKWYVCKYVGKPGVDERLQTGDNPIFVDEHWIEVSPVVIGATFSDEHGRSIVIAGPYKHKPEVEPGIDDCPPPSNNPCYMGDSGGPEDCLVTPELEWTPPTCDEDGSLTIGDDERYRWEAVLNEDGSTTYTAVIVQNDTVGYYNFPPGAQTQWTVPDLSQLPKDSDECSTEEPLERTLSQPVIVDECGTENDEAALPEDTDGVDYERASDDESDLDIVATVNEGYVVTVVAEGWVEQEDGSFYFDWTYDFSEEDCPLLPGDIGAVCVGDVPFLGYGVTLPEGFEADSDTPVTITFVNPDEEDYVVENQPLEGTLLWPGASDASPQQWPGWALVDGEYVNVGNDNFGWTREGVTVVFEVNPTYETVVEYPAATEACANPPADTTPPPPTPANTGSAGSLAMTGGSDVPPLLPIGGGLILLIGALAMFVARVRTI